MKICKKCKEEKEITDFYEDKRLKDGYQSSCKVCESKRSLEYYNKNREIRKEKKKENYYKNQEANLLKKKEYDDKNRDKVNKKARERYHLNKGYYIEYYKKNKESILERNKKWIQENKEYFSKINIENTKSWLKRNPHIVIWRQIVYRTIRKFGKTKKEKTIELLGYTPNELKIHIESLFENGMTWENWGEWHIDHIKPLSTFDSDSNISEVNALSNLRPLWAEDNLKRPRTG